MYLFYEEDGGFKIGHIMAETDTSLQVESESGKRSKIKRANALFSFDTKDASGFLAQAQAQAEDVDLDFLWECCGTDDFEAAVFAEDYYGHTPSALEKAALILRLHSAPIYFHRRGKGRYRAAPADILAAAKAAQEKKRLQAEQQQQWVDALVAGQLPPEIAQAAEMLLIRPDKNSMAWKAMDAACQQLQKSPERLLLDLGAWPSPLALHKARFLAANFPRGTAFPAITLPALSDELPLAEVQAYSIDDITTTEIDDALSVQPLDGGLIRIGIHVAVPGLLVTRSSELDKLARARLSTVYTPGEKIPMLPDEVISRFSLDAGHPVPALSLYVDGDPATGEITQTTTRLERVSVSENLRHNNMDAIYTEEALAGPVDAVPHLTWMQPLWQMALALSARRDAVRGKPENNNRVEYSFYLDGSADDPNSPVRIEPRRRNAPLDRLVAEYMILANSTWGEQLAKLGLPGIYRSQQTGRTRMSTHALPHESIGVPQYAWCTSPLRRYVDLVNQWQLIAAAQHGISAPLVAPFKPRDADLFAIIGAFEAQYAIWHDHQDAMERYWCLRWFQQQGLQEVTAHVLREDLVRFACAPFVTRVAGMPEFERGTAVKLALGPCDELALTVDCRYLGAIEENS